jgi:hypothetical protein
LGIEHGTTAWRAQVHFCAWHDESHEPRPQDNPVNWLQKLPGFTRSAPGLEWALWKKLPWIALAGTALPLALVGLAWLAAPQTLPPVHERQLTQWLYMAIGVVVLHWSLLLTAAIGCVIVMLMKGPAYVADGLEVPHTDRPGSPTSDPVHDKS